MSVVNCHRCSVVTWDTDVDFPDFDIGDRAFCQECMEVIAGDYDKPDKELQAIREFIQWGYKASERYTGFATNKGDCAALVTLECVESLKEILKKHNIKLEDE